jgi:hypothetical protein
VGNAIVLKILVVNVQLRSVPDGMDGKYSCMFTTKILSTIALPTYQSSFTVLRHISVTGHHKFQVTTPGMCSCLNISNP